MCLSIPGKVLSIEKDKIIVDYGSEKRESNFSLVDVVVGDYVIVSNKFIVAKLNKDEAEGFLEIIG